MVSLDSAPAVQHDEITRKLVVEKIDYLFTKMGTHRETPERKQWLLEWSGANNINNYENLATGLAIFQSRLNFLQKAWCDTSNFRPFDTVKSSTAFLMKHPQHSFLIRLSTTVPGGITMTFKHNPKNIYHTRFEVNIRGYVVDSLGKEHETIGSLAEWFAHRKFETKATSPAGYTIFSPSM
jgi:hypothetical protein